MTRNRTRSLPGGSQPPGKHRDGQRPRGYWKEWANVKREAAEITKRFGTIPSCRVLEREGYAAFVRGVSRHWGGIGRLMRALGDLTEGRTSNAGVRRRGTSNAGVRGPDGRASDGDWKPGHWTEATFEEAIEEVIERYGNIPPKHWLARDGYPSTLDRLIRQHGGYRALRSAHGLPEWEPVYPPWVQRGERTK